MAPLLTSHSNPGNACRAKDRAGQGCQVGKPWSRSAAELCWPRRIVRRAPFCVQVETLGRAQVEVPRDRRAGGDSGRGGSAQVPLARHHSCWLASLGRELYDRRVGLIAAAILGFNFWHVMLSRDGYRVALLPVWLVWLCPAAASRMAAEQCGR